MNPNQADRQDGSTQPSLETLKRRLVKLTLPEAEVPLDEFCSATSALACFPIYMVATASQWMQDDDDRTKLLNLVGFSELRNAYAAGKVEARLEISDLHAKTLEDMVRHAKATDVIIYDFALDTLSQYFQLATDEQVERTKQFIAKGVSKVAATSGEGWFGRGEDASRDQQACIEEIVERLQLASSGRLRGLLADASEPAASN